MTVSLLDVYGCGLDDHFYSSPKYFVSRSGLKCDVKHFLIAMVLRVRNFKVNIFS